MQVKSPSAAPMKKTFNVYICVTWMQQMYACAVPERPSAPLEGGCAGRLVPLESLLGKTGCKAALAVLWWAKVPFGWYIFPKITATE